MSGTLFDKTFWLGLYGAAADPTGCGSPARLGEGAGNGYHGYVWYDETGNRVAVLLLNRDSVDAAGAARRLYCGA